MTRYLDIAKKALEDWKAQNGPPPEPNPTEPVAAGPTPVTPKITPMFTVEADGWHKCGECGHRFATFAGWRAHVASRRCDEIRRSE